LRVGEVNVGPLNFALLYLNERFGHCRSCLSFRKSGLETPAVKLGKGLAFADLLVEVGQHLRELPGELRADFDSDQRVERACRRNDLAHVSPLYSGHPVAVEWKLYATLR
jgi:hypothetical protein